jgi:hypothetical protein
MQLARITPLAYDNSYAPPSGAEPRSAHMGATLCQPVNAAVGGFPLFSCGFLLFFWFFGFTVFFWFLFPFFFVLFLS